MDIIVFSSLLLLGSMNFLVAELYINQTSSVNVMSLFVAAAIILVVHVTGFDPLATGMRSFAFVTLSNLLIIGVMIGAHYTPVLDEMLFSSSKKYVAQQDEYARLLR